MEAQGQTAVQGRPRVERGLWPHEHGAYVELALPMLTALLFGRPTLAAVGYALAACAVFVAHEPLLVWLGKRGERRRMAQGEAALQRMARCALLALFGAALGVWAGPRDALTMIAVPLLLGGASMSFILRGREQSLLGELCVATTLTSLALPIYVASEIAPRVALELALAWSIIHLLATVTARAIVYRKREGERMLGWASGLSLWALGAGALLHAMRAVPLTWCLAPWPFALLIALLAFGVIRPRTPKPVGWALAGASLMALVLFGLGLQSLV